MRLITIKQIRVLNILFILLLATACNYKQSDDAEKLRAENDSLLTYKRILEDEVNDYFSTFNDIQEGIAKIKAAQNVIPIHPLSENSPVEMRNRVKSDIQFIQEMIQSNREELDNMRDKLFASNLNIQKLNQTLDLLTKQLNEESAKVAHLERQLIKRDSIIAEMGVVVDELGKDLEEMAEQNSEKEEVILEQEQTIHMAWYAVGNQKELKDNNIITSEGIFSSKRILQSDFNKNYFVQVDIRDIRNIPLYTTSKSKVLTNHPKTSYQIIKEESSYVLQITDPEKFWTISRYLVVEID